MKHIKSYKYHSCYPKWSADYWESNKEKFLKDNKLEIVKTEHYKESDTIQFCITTSESNFQKMSKLYNNMTKFNL